MFEAAQLGRKVSRKEFNTRDPEIHSALLAVQRRFREAGDFPVIVIVSGVEGAGKGSVVSLLHKWMDARGLETNAFWDETDDERLRPRYWRFWRAMPPKGKIGIMFGSWYTQPIINRAFKRSKRDHFDRELDHIRRFEDMLVDDGALIIKLWFHLSKKAQQKRLKADAKGNGMQVSPLTRVFAQSYDRFASVSERALRKTDVAHSPWHIIEAENTRYRDLKVGEIILDRLTTRLDQPPQHRVRVTASPVSLHKAGEPTILSAVPLNAILDDKTYKNTLDKYQAKLYALGWKAHKKGANAVAVFEGWDAAGKGGAIRRVTQALDARLYRVISVAAPTDEEKAQHYLWRFWRHIPRGGYHTLYDRSWYGRVLVERVEGFASELEWQRAYNEINLFEEQLVEHGTVVFKFWIHIDAEEQLRRFREREQIEYKQHKITDEDWRNRERWDDYECAVSDMVTRTSTEIAPWTLVAGNDKRYARIEVLKTFVEGLDATLS